MRSSLPVRELVVRVQVGDRRDEQAIRTSLTQEPNERVLNAASAFNNRAFSRRAGRKTTSGLDIQRTVVMTEEIKIVLRQTERKKGFHAFLTSDVGDRVALFRRAVTHLAVRNDGSVRLNAALSAEIRSKRSRRWRRRHEGKEKPTFVVALPIRENICRVHEGVTPLSPRRKKYGTHLYAF